MSEGEARRSSSQGEARRSSSERGARRSSSTQPLTDAELEVVLRPYESEIVRVYEVFTFRRPLAYVLLLAVVFGTFGFAVQSEAGAFASIALVLFVAYVAFAVWSYFGAKIGPFLFPAKEFPGFPSFEEIVKQISIFYAGPGAAAKGTILGGACLGLAFVFRYVPALWLTLALAIIVLVGPGVLLHPAVYPYWSPYLLNLQVKQKTE
jgi:hypothetical protein